MDAQWWFPSLAAFAISFFTSMVGISGAFLLLPIQMSILGFTSPAVSATNLVFNLVAIPAGVYRYWREQRILWPLSFLVVAGTLPGVVVGGFIRLSYLADARRFKLFVGFVLFYMGWRLLAEMWRSREQVVLPVPKDEGNTQILRFTLGILIFQFRQYEYRCRPAGIFVLSLLVGLIGGIYGIGGGSIIAPFFVTFYGLPIHAIAGATLMGTFATSVVGVSFYQLVAPWYQAAGLAVAPDWLLGIRFGLGGIAGMYLGARTQRFIPAGYLKVILALILFGVALGYLWGYVQARSGASYFAAVALLFILAFVYIRARCSKRRNSRASSTRQ
jgi:hypothetical protein